METETAFRSRAERYGRFGDDPETRSRLDRLADRIREGFAPGRLRDHLLGPFRHVLHPAGETTDDQVRSTITLVAVVNAVLAGLPGRMGVGVAVSMALELVMAYRIARHVGVRVDRPSDTLKYFGLVAGTLVTVLWLFRQLLGFAFSLFAVVPGVNPMIPAEIAVTDLVGVLFWIGFREAKEHGSSRVPRRMALFGLRETKALLRYQWNALRSVLTPSNVGTVARRMRAWLTGDVVTPRTPSGAPRIGDEAFVGIAAAALLSREHARLDGPLGREFVASIRDLYPDLRDADLDTIAARFEAYDASQRDGALANVKGRLFERLAEQAENADGDAWVARLHENRTHPGTDMVLEHTETGASYAVSLKATDSPAYIEHALARYPDAPVVATDEVAAEFDGDPRVSPSGYSNADLDRVTRENFDDLLASTPPSRLDAAGGVAAGSAAATVLALWPFVIAYHRGRIDGDDLEEAFLRIVGDGGARLAVHVVAAVALGPLYLWYVLARAVTGFVRPSADD